MKSKSTALNLSSTFGMESILQRKTMSTLVLGLLLLALAFGAVFAVMSVIEPRLLSGTSAGLEASSARWAALGEYFGAESRVRSADAARWSALGEYYAPNYEAIAAVNSARWSALGNLYRNRLETSLEASSARWAALGEYFGADSRARTADTARWSALGEFYTPNYEAIQTINSARWSALGTSLMARYENAAAISSARYQALGRHYEAETANLARSEKASAGNERMLAATRNMYRKR